jgi:hypothetical protein
MSDQKQSILLGGLVAALLATILTFPAQGGNPIVGFAACCIPAILGGLIAVWHYTNTNNLTLAMGAGAKLGAMAGLVGALISTVLSYVLKALGLLPSTSEAAEIQRQAMIERGMTDQQIEQAMRIAEMSSGILGQLVFVIVGCLIFALIGALGGLIGASMFKKGPTAPAV